MIKKSIQEKQVNCTCGHSWNKSSSSKKDMKICHICGKDNTMKNGGWLDAYDEEMQLGGNVYSANYVPQAQNGLEASTDGFTDQGFNYNGAWGGTMQFGGVLNFLEPTSKKLPEGYNPKAKGSSTEYATSIGGEDGELAYLIPEFKYGKLLNDPKTEFRRTGDYLGGPFKTHQEADQWERDIRHPYVEKGQTIPTPLRRWGKDFAMGGSLPGSVGFTYARTKGIPSNGPYAKKTLASAQNGQEMKFYQEGLDWKPRNISRNGSEIPKAQMGTMVTPLDFSKPLGTLEGVSEVMSAPARTATYLLTGKYQDPSKALGIKNPWGAIAADMVLDPMNLVGAGIAGKATKAAVKASMESGALSKAYKYNPWAFKANPEAAYRGIGEAGYNNLLSSGEVRSLKQNAYPEPYFAKGQEPGNYAKGYMIELNPNEPMKGVGAFTDYHNDLIGTPVNKVTIDNPNLKILKKDWLKGYKEVKKPKKKEGGEITKDDNGYWNPENWGKPVEIGSNNITMQGVNEPLIGVSDTGDVQMMYPGEDYTFDGESVTEYPIAQKGMKVVPQPTRTDSLNIYNYAVAQDSHYRKNIEPYAKKTVTPYIQDYPKIIEGLKKTYQFFPKSNLPENQKKLVAENNNPNIVYGLGIANAEGNYSKELLNKVDARIKPQQFIRYDLEYPQIDSNDGQANAYNVRAIADRNKPQEYMELSNLNQSTFDLILGRNKTIKQKIGDYKGNYDKVIKKIKKTNPNVNIEDVVKKVDRFEKGSKEMPAWKTGRIYYDPLAVKPYDMRTPQEKIEWEKKYGKPKPAPKKEQPTKQVDKPQPKQELVKKQEPTAQPVVQPTPMRQYTGSPVYSSAVGSGAPSALVGFVNPQGDTTYIKPEDYQRYGVPAYGKEYIESKTKKKKNGGWLDEWN